MFVETGEMGDSVGVVGKDTKAEAEVRAEADGREAGFLASIVIIGRSSVTR